MICLAPSFACPKEGARKGHPDCADPSDYLALLVIVGTLKKLGCASDRFNVFFQQQLRCSAAQDGVKI
jgi:hypothetical protein